MDIPVRKLRFRLVLLVLDLLFTCVHFVDEAASFVPSEWRRGSEAGSLVHGLRLRCVV